LNDHIPELSVQSACLNVDNTDKVDKSIARLVASQSSIAQMSAQGN